MAVTTLPGYADALRRETMRSEIQRVQVVAILLASLLAITTFALNVMPDLLARRLEDRFPGWMPLVGIGPFVVYEFVVLAVLRRRAAQGRDFPRIARFVNAFVETSLPSVVIFSLSHYMDPASVFGFWPPMLYFLFILLSTLRLDFALSLWTGAVAAVEQVLLAMWFIPLQLFGANPEHALMFHLSRSIVLLAGGAVAGLVARQLRRQFEQSVVALAARDHVTNLFGQHVSPAVVDRLLATRRDPPSEMREVCVLFLDIRGFTAMARVRPAGETVELLNDFFAEMIDIVDRHNGIINKFLGDGFLALFGAPIPDPEAAHNALAAGRAMLDAVERWNRVRPDEALRIGIGIHLGEAVTGTVGSPRRKEYTVIGDTVNLAARLEQLTKETGAQLLVSGSVREATGGADGAIDLGPLAVRGYDEGVRVWKVV